MPRLSYYAATSLPAFLEALYNDVLHAPVDEFSYAFWLTSFLSVLRRIIYKHLSWLVCFFGHALLVAIVAAYEWLLFDSVIAPVFGNSHRTATYILVTITEIIYLKASFTKATYTLCIPILTDDNNEKENCKRCRSRRSERGAHCKIEDRCIDRYDHFCPWIMRAVGKGNYIWYVLVSHVSYAHSTKWHQTPQLTPRTSDNNKQKLQVTTKKQRATNNTSRRHRRNGFYTHTNTQTQTLADFDLVYNPPSVCNIVRSPPLSLLLPPTSPRNHFQIDKLHHSEAIPCQRWHWHTCKARGGSLPLLPRADFADCIAAGVSFNDHIKEPDHLGVQKRPEQV